MSTLLVEITKGDGQMKCLECGIEFSDNRKGKKYCSVNCKSRYNMRTRAGTKNCKECGKEFSPSSPRVVFCSVSCSSTNSHKSLKTKLLVCTRCEVEFEFKGTTKAKYCTDCRKVVNSEKSIKSRIKLGIQKTTGTGKGGWQKSGDNSTTRSAEGAKQREKVYYENCLSRFEGNESCVVCGDDLNIQVHHIDHNPNNHEETNLVFLCRKCHVNHHMRKLLTTEHIKDCIDIRLRKTCRL